MAHHPPGDASPFRKRYLVPLWCIRIAIMSLSIALNGLAVGALAYYQRHPDELDEDQADLKYNLKTALSIDLAVAIVLMLLVTACLALDVVCIVKRCRHTLRPKFFLLANIAQTTLWTVMFVLSFFTAFSVLSVFVHVIPLMSFVLLLVYASVVYRREKRGTLSSRATYATTPLAGAGDGDGQFHMQSSAGYSVHEQRPYGQTYPDAKPMYAAAQGRQ